MKLESRHVGFTVYRKVLSLIVITDMIFYLPLAQKLLGKDGIIPYKDYIKDTSFLRYPFEVEFAPEAFVLLVLTVSFLFLIGFKKKWSGTILLVCLIILHARASFVLDGSDNVILVTLPYLLFWLFTENNTKPVSLFGRVLWKSPSKSVSTLIGIAFMAQICFVYLFGAIAKSRAEMWQDGTALYYVLLLDDFRATSWNVPLAQNFWFVKVGTYATLLWEMAFAFLVWFKRTKILILAIGIGFHIGIYIFMRIEDFSWIMIASYAVFITDVEYHTYHKALKFFKKDLVVR